MSPSVSRRPLSALRTRLAADRRPRPRAGTASGHAAAEVEALEERAMLTMYVVNSTEDPPISEFADGQLTLREAVLAANFNVAVGDAAAGSATEVDTIVFNLPAAAGQSPTIALRFGQFGIGGALPTAPSFGSSLIIDGATAGGGRVRIDAGGTSRIFDVATTGAALALGNLELVGGVADFGGAAVVRDGAGLGLTNVRAAGNAAQAGGGAFASLGGSVLLAQGGE